MRARRHVVVVTTLLLSLTEITPTLAKKTSTPEDRAKAVKLAYELEEDPMASGAGEKRRWLINWYEKVPDITVQICNLLGPLPSTDHPFFYEVLMQGMFSQGAFVIEHPERSGDEVAVQTAGMLGALKVYEQFSDSLPSGRLPFLDDLLRRRDAGALPTYMTEAVAKGCK